MQIFNNEDRKEDKLSIDRQYIDDKKVLSFLYGVIQFLFEALHLDR